MADGGGVDEAHGQGEADGRTALAEELQAARLELLAAMEGISQDDFERPPAGASEQSEGGERWAVRDVLWHVGLVEDWLRRVVSQASAGRPLDRYQVRQRPAITSEVEHLREWLDQCRRPTLALLRRLPEDHLDREFTLPEGEVRTARRLLTHIARHDRQHAEQVRTLRGPQAV